MARIAHEDIAQVLSDISNILIDDPVKTPLSALLGAKIAMTITDWLEERPETLQKLYDEKLHITTE